MSWISISQMAIGALASLFLVTGLASLLRRPRIWRSPPYEVLVLVAHQDDCVVVAGEYAFRALNAGKRVRIVYLTCGADDPRSSRAVTRSREASAAWGSVGVPPEDLHFLGYRQSQIDSTCTLTLSESIEATARIEALIRETGPGADVFLPAAGESHVDHREIRRIGLKAMRDSGRTDLTVLEAPEYNPYYCLLRSPGKVMRYLVSSIPVISWLALHVRRPAFPGFVRAGRAYRLLDDDAGFRQKIKLLHTFASEDGDLLVRYFGWRSRFRPMKWMPPSKDEKFGIHYIRVGERWLGLSVVALWSAIYLLGFGLSSGVARGFMLYLPGPMGILANVCVIGLFGILAFRGQKQIETQLLYASGSVGMIAEWCSISWR